MHVEGIGTAEGTFCRCFEVCYGAGFSFRSVGRVEYESCTEHYRQEPKLRITAVVAYVHCYGHIVYFKLLQAVAVPEIGFAGMNLRMRRDNAAVGVVNA